MNDSSTRSPTRHAFRVLGITFLLYALLVATNEGEFWPFSIFPMFSQAGNPWSRSVVREVDADYAAGWGAVNTEGLPGEGYPLLTYGVDPIDLANFVKKTERWTPTRADALQRMLAPSPGDHLIVFRADGRMEDSDRVTVAFVPVAYVTADSIALNPVLPR